MTDTAPQPSVARGISRRRFLIAAAATAAAAPATAGVARLLTDSTPIIDLDRLNVPRLSIGYVDGSAAYAALSRSAWLRDGTLGGASVVPAAAARTGDRGLVGRLAKVTVHGLHPTSSLDDSIARIAVNGLFASPRSDAPWPFFAWTLARGDATAASRRSSFQVALDRHPRFGIALEIGTSSGFVQGATVFGTGTGQHLAKLRPGAYLLAIGHDAWDRRRALPQSEAAWTTLRSIVVTIEPVA